MIENYTFPGQKNSILLWQHAKIQQKMAENQLEIDKEVAKVCIREESKLRLYDRSMKLRQEDEERKRATFEEVSVAQDGSIVVITRNLSIQAQPRRITNMNRPQIYIAERTSGKIRKVFLLRCWVGENEKVIFLNARKIESGAYLLGKFAATGITVLAPSARAKNYARQLLTLLVNQGIEVEIPDEPGWVITGDGKLVFVEEGRITWKDIVEQI